MKTPIALLIGSLLACSPLYGQAAKATINVAEQRTVIDSLCSNLDREYMFPEVAAKYIGALKDNLRAGHYDQIQDPASFAQRVTEDLAGIHRDEHLIVRYDPEWVSGTEQRAERDEEAIARKQRQDRINNYGFQGVEILPGNIGYLRLGGFSYEYEAYPVAIAAMQFFANTDALIIDLRRNGGGSPEMVQFLCSYVLGIPRKHLNSFYYKEEDKTTQYWTYTYVPGTRLDSVDLYVLTSTNTFSAAEEFSYNLKNMKRATIIGEVNGGGAHDNKFVALNEHFYMSLPFARAFNPITKTNWEGVGVEPDVKVSSSKALATAQLMAIKRMGEKEKDPRYKRTYAWLSETYDSELNPVTIPLDVLKSYVGKYGPRAVTMENGSLYYQRDEQARMKMIPMAEDYFMFDENNYFRLKFLKEKGNVVAVEGHNPEGPTDRHLKEK